MVEMAHFQMTKSVNLINGSFTLLHYGLIKVSFNVQENEIYFGYDEAHFTNPLKREQGKELFDLWHTQEKEEYITFIQDYLNEIRAFDSHSEFKGEIVQEEKVQSLNSGAKYNIDVKYKNIPHNVRFIFFENNSYNQILCHIHLPINSENELAHPILLGRNIKEETKKRMWEPFRDKTEFRLNLLHKLR